MQASDLWEQILERARAGLPEHSYTTWFSSARALSWDGSLLRVAAPSRFHAEWIEDKYGDTVRRIAAEVLGVAARISFAAAETEADRSAPAPAGVSVTPVAPEADAALASACAPRTGAAAGPAAGEVPGVNPRYTFERFVVGEDNRLAQAASLAVADRPARSYNPLFLYGATGLGKTHLMQAIANRILRAGRRTGERTRICYVPAEQFVNDLVRAIYKHRTDAFRARYRSYDLLLVDDVQFLRRKERTQEEFFHTFNVLYNRGRQIVLTSDRQPRDLDGLEDRLVSRFDWGLVAAVHPPDYETRLAILRAKAEEGGVELEPEVLDHIARACSSSVRQLEGAMIKLFAVSSLMKRRITLELARRALVGVAGGQGAGAAVDADRIRAEVAAAWDVSPEALDSARRSRNIVVPRQVAMYLARRLLEISFAEIGRAFGGRDHSTVMHAVRKVQREIKADDCFRRQVEGLRTRLERAS